MVLDDIDEVLLIERDAFTTPWEREAFETELTKNQFACYYVVVVEGKVVGYCGLWKVMDEAQITNVAVASDYRGHSYGESLMRYVMEWLKALGVVSLSLEVRVSNTPAQSLYQKLGFRKAGIRKNYYADNQEDAWVMWVKLNDNDTSN
ncbi:ribosomal protein S18-alanine N-acetyltransferase [Alkalihalobacillus clausii]|uniref:ribosomal protein S18-alanine N-acetyltransferase n=1 Tax=Shouchella clausii TaxID=79880 RepID=UPI000BA5811E|nr:ribosomal protein S18-alanine N-acetyltransferase [Shouchella clausii]MCM3550224.1 ribosomal protein S18-alanine N-acetyltransferase [Shouchella clausii]PAF13478.1 ribosomal-protein-alanine N-acetyltransferase [Shouchella clausii]